MKRTKLGFTLIELLVVISIIGLLSSIILASLSSARTKSVAARIQADMVGMRSQAELYYLENKSYGIAQANTNCPLPATSGVSVFHSTGTGGLRSMVNDIVGLLGNSAAYTRCSTGKVGDISTTETWAIAVQDPANSSQAFCVDSAGTSKIYTYQSGQTIQNVIIRDVTSSRCR